MPEPRPLRPVGRSRRVGSVVALLALAGVGTAACSSSAPASGVSASGTSSTAPAAARPTGSATPSAPTLPVSTLTGTPLERSVASRPAVAVALGAGTATGLDAADILFAEFGDAASARAVAVFQSRDATVGPVGQTRPADSRLLTALLPIFAYSGGPTGMVRQLERSPVISAGAPAHASLFGRSGATLTASTATVRTLAPRTPAPPAQFRFAASGENLSTTPTTRPGKVAVTPTGESASTASWDAGSGRWRCSLAVGSSRLAFTAGTVVVEENTFHRADSRAAPVLTADVFGSGRATVLSGGGQSVVGSWTKNGATSPTLYRDPTDAPLRFSAGPVLVLLVPAGTKVTPS